MAKRGSNKELSVRQEDWVARMYHGRRSPSSGAAVTDQGDVRTKMSLIECKTTGYPGKEPKPKTPRFIKWLEKAVQEAHENGLEGSLAMRFYDPESILATPDGWIDVMVRPIGTDALRESAYCDQAD